MTRSHALLLISYMLGASVYLALCAHEYHPPDHVLDWRAVPTNHVPGQPAKGK